MKRDLVLEQLVIEEATNLKKYATKKELFALSYKELVGSDVKYCIYGQMTGHCRTKRSYNLIRKCCKKIYEVKDHWNVIASSILSGKPKVLIDIYDRLEYYISPIEKFLYIYKPDTDKKSIKIKKLVDFLKDETKELKF